MGFLRPEKPKAPTQVTPEPDPIPTRADPSVALAGLRVAQRENTGSLAQQAATSTRSGGLGGRETTQRRKRTLIGGAT